MFVEFPSNRDHGVQDAWAKTMVRIIYGPAHVTIG